MCWAINKPGTSLIRSCDELTGRKLRSKALMVWNELLFREGDIITSFKSKFPRVRAMIIFLPDLSVVMIFVLQPMQDIVSTDVLLDNTILKSPSLFALTNLPSAVMVAYSTV